MKRLGIAGLGLLTIFMLALASRAPRPIRFARSVTELPVARTTEVASWQEHWSEFLPDGRIVAVYQLAPTEFSELENAASDAGWEDLARWTPDVRISDFDELVSAATPGMVLDVAEGATRHTMAALLPETSQLVVVYVVW